MRLFGLFFLLFLLFPSLCNASNLYVGITKTTNPKQVNRIKSILYKYGVRSGHKTTRTGYLIYSGPYEDRESAQYDISKIKKYFPYAKVFEVKTKTKARKRAIIGQPAVIRTNKKINMDGYFTQGSLGYSNIPLTHTGKFEIYLPKENGISYDISLGRYIRENIFLTAGLLRADTKDIVFDNLYVSANYEFGPYGKYTPYFGLSFGYSTATWNLNPLDNSKNPSSNSSNSLFGGSQIGAIYDGFDSVLPYINYQCLFMNHNTDLNNGTQTSELKHKSLHNLQIGIRYNF